MNIKRKVYIFGAHSRGQTLAVYLQYLYPGLEIEAYLYDNEEDNPGRIESVPVLHIDKEELLHTEYPVYIGTRGVFHKEIASYLRELGFKEIYPVTVELDMQLRNAYLKKYYGSIGRRFNKINDLEEKEPGAIRKKLQEKVYVVRSAADRPLQQEYQLASYEREIQAGADLTDKRLADGILCDNDGENISDKNKQFCELTVLYWLWKHAEEDVVGLEHYRRHFILPDDWLERMEACQIDVILPVPLYVAPSVAENYKSRHEASDWEFMMGYLRAQDEESYQGAVRFFNKNLYSPCNMFIMRNSVLKELGEWLFPVLDAAVKNGGQKEDCYQNRYPGFLAERLISYFFEKNKDKYKLVYADKNFLQ